MTTAPVRRSSPGRLPAAERRRQLISVAIVTFARKGYDATSMDEIAEAAGVTKPVLYQHFRSKRALYMELLDHVGGQLLEAIAEATARASGPKQQVQEGFAAYFRFVVDHQSSFRLLFASGAQRDEAFDLEVRKVEETIAEAVASLIDADLEPVHRRILGYAVVGLAEGTSRHWISSAPSAERAIAGEELELMRDPDWLAHRIADLAWAGLRAVRPG